MRAVLISVSKAPSWQCAADALPAICDHTVLSTTRNSIKANPSLPIWEEGQTSANYCRNLPGGEAGTNLYCLVNRGTRMWTTCPRSLPGSAPARSRTCNLRVTSLARYRYRLPSHTSHICTDIISLNKLKMPYQSAQHPNPMPNHPVPGASLTLPFSGCFHLRLQLIHCAQGWPSHSLTDCEQFQQRNWKI